MTLLFLLVIIGVVAHWEDEIGGGMAGLHFGRDLLIEGGFAGGKFQPAPGDFYEDAMRRSLERTIIPIVDAQKMHMAGRRFTALLDAHISSGRAFFEDAVVLQDGGQRFGRELANV
ncbi:hypothetical protein HC776_01600 [bacterium]|nr:hypothetical protein [bacterium]